MKAFFLTLMDQPARRVNTFHNMGHLSYWGYVCEEVEAVDYRTPRFKEAIVAEGAGLAAGEIATTESHRRLFQKVVEVGETCLIVEDDALFTQNLPPEWATGIKHIMSCGFYDCSVPDSPKLEFHGETPYGIETTGMPWGTQAYFLTPEGAALLLEHITPIRDAIDMFFGRMSREGVIQGCVAKQCCVGQNHLIKSFVGQR